MKSIQAFTIIELLVVMGIMAILFSLSTINLMGSKHKASLNSSINVLISDLASQQLKAMVGDTEGRGGSPDNYGIYLQTGNYVLFHGINYLSTDLANFPVNLGDNIQIDSTSFPQSQIVFTAGNGKLISGAGLLIVKNTVTGEQKTITLNQYGIITQVN
jgi:prepilin-type N-terminal cleavage/methylation domain-containing protein